MLGVEGWTCDRCKDRPMPLQSSSSRLGLRHTARNETF